MERKKGGKIPSDTSPPRQPWRQHKHSRSFVDRVRRAVKNIPENIHKNAKYFTVFLLSITAFYLFSMINAIELMTDVIRDETLSCIPDEKIIMKDYGNYVGMPGKCDCHGNCWDKRGLWYADPDYDGNDKSWGFPNACDGQGNCWNNFGAWYEDPYFPFAYEFVGFADIDSESTLYEAVMYVGDKGLFKGYDDGTFRPDQPINRVEMLKVILDGFGYSIHDAPESYEGFYDIDKESWYMPYIYTANVLNILTGYADGTIRPGDTVNRAEMLKVFLETANIKLEECTENIFIDVSMNEWHCPYIKFAKDYALIDTNDGSFGPSKLMTRGDVAKLFYYFDLNYLGVK